MKTAALSVGFVVAVLIVARTLIEGHRQLGKPALSLDLLFAPPNTATDDAKGPDTTRTSLGDFFHLLCHHNVTKCCRNESRLDVLDELSMMLGALQVHDQPSPLQIQRHQPPPLNCSRYQVELRRKRPENATLTRDLMNNFEQRRRLLFVRPVIAVELLRPMFAGPATTKRPMIDILMVSHELDILQARMHEFDSVMSHYVIAESAYNHRGWKKHRFVQEEMAKPNNRFAPFQDKIIYVDIDECPLYREAVDTERRTGEGVGNNVWSIQEAMRECLWPNVKPRLSHLPNSTLVLFSDLDWVPCLEDLRHMSHCQPSPEYGNQSHYRMTLKHKTQTSFALYAPGTELANEKFSVTPLGRIRTDNKIQLRGFPAQKGPHERKFTMHPIMCGVHLQLMGSLANVIYREVTHAEGSYLDRLQRILEGRGYCEIDDAFLQQQQELASQHPDYFHWRNLAQQFVPRNSTTDTMPLSEEELQVMRRKVQVPSVLIDKWQWFPFLWGTGSYEMYSKV